MHQQTIALRNALNSTLASLPPQVQEVIKSDFVALPPSADLKKANVEFKSKHKGSVAHTLAAIRVDKILGAEKKACEKAVFAILDTEGLPLSDAVAGLDTLNGWGSSEVEAFKLRARSKWADASVFA